MRVFLTGATGYIGSAVLDVLVRHEHEVTALVRQASRLQHGSGRGVQALVADLGRPETWAPSLPGHDVFIHTAFEASPRGAEVDRQALDAILSGARKAAADGIKRTVIYTSGVWVLGNTSQPADESAAPQATEIVAWRPAHEAVVLKAHGKKLRTAVVRPGIVFGGGRGIVGEMFRDAANGLIRVVGSGQNHWALVYDRDLADLYLRLAANPKAHGLFHATDETDERVDDIVVAMSAHMSVRPDVRRIPIEEARAKSGPYADALALDQLVRCVRSRKIGWTPGVRSVADNVSRLYEEWRRARKTAEDR